MFSPDPKDSFEEVLKLPPLGAAGMMAVGVMIAMGVMVGQVI